MFNKFVHTVLSVFMGKKETFLKTLMNYGSLYECFIIALLTFLPQVIHIR